MAFTTSQKRMEVLLTAKDKTAKGFKKMSKNAKESAKAISQAMKAIKIATLGMAVAIGVIAVKAMKKLISITTDLIKGAIETAGAFEALTVQFGVLFGSVEEGKKAFDDLWDVAKRLPFTIDEIARSAKTLKAWGVIGNDIKTVMVGLADASALTGQSMEVMSTVIGRAWQQGTFLTRGPGALLRGIMQTRMGIEDITKLTLPQFQDALARLMTDPQFGVKGMATKLAGTFQGLKSMINDAMTNIKLAISKTGLFDSFKMLQQDILTWLKLDKTINAIKRIGKIASTVIEEFRQTFIAMVVSGDMETLIKDWVQNVARWAKTAIAIIKALPALASGLMSFITSLSMAFKGFFTMVGGFFEKLNDFGIGSNLNKDIAQVEVAISKITERTKELQGELTGLSAENLEKRAKGLEKMYKRATGAHKKYLWHKWAGALRDQENAEIERRHRTDRLTGLGKEKAFLADRLISLKKLQALLSGQMGTIKEINFAGDKQNESSKVAEGTLASILNITKQIAGETNKGVEAFNLSQKAIESTSAKWEAFIDEIKQSSDNIVEISRGTAQAMAGAFEDMFFDIMIGEFKTLGDYARAFGRDVLGAVAQVLAMKTAMGIGGLFGGTQPMLTPGGMNPMQPGMLPMSPMSFSEGGIVPGIGNRDTIPAMLTPGEIVLSKGMQKGLMEGGGGTTINNHYHTHVNAVDAPSFVRLATKNSKAMRAISGANIQKNPRRVR